MICHIRKEGSRDSGRECLNIEKCKRGQLYGSPGLCQKNDFPLSDKVDVPSSLFT